MICQYCKQALEHDHRIIPFEGKLFHEVDCFTDYMIEKFADDEPTTYLEYLEKLVMDHD